LPKPTNGRCSEEVYRAGQHSNLLIIFADWQNKIKNQVEARFFQKRLYLIFLLSIQKNICRILVDFSQNLPLLDLQKA